MIKLAFLVAGTNHVYCGTCLRDHAAVRGLRQLGVEVSIVPLYLPLMTEQAEDSTTPLFLGGVNLYLQYKSSLFRHTPAWMGRLLDSPWLLDKSAKMAGMTEPRDLGALTVATLHGERGPLETEIRRMTTWLSAHGPFDALCLSNALLLGLVPALRRELAVPLICTFQGEESFVESLPEPFRAQAWALLCELAPQVDVRVTVSQYYARQMAQRLELAEHQFIVVHNGLPLDDAAEAAPTIPTIGFLSQLTPMKGLDTLVTAFIELKRKEGLPPDLRLHVAGAVVPGFERFAEEQRARLVAAGYEADFQFRTNITRAEKLEFLTKLSVLSVPATYGEAFGLYVLEALAAAVPVVQPEHGAFPELLAITGGGVLYDPADANGLTAALARVLADEGAARQLGRQGRAVVHERFSQQRMAKELADILEGLVAAPAYRESKGRGTGDA